MPAAKAATTPTGRERAKFAHDGYLVIDDVGFSDALLNGIVTDLEGLYEGDERIVDGVFYSSHRIGGAWKISDHVKSLALNRKLLAIVEELYGRKALPFQTLNFRKGTEQPTHSDTIHFNSLPRGFMCGAWVALEDIDMQNGPVVYYPGSQKLREITLDDVGPGADEAAYCRFIAAMIERLDLRPEYATIRRGQTLLWAGNLLHGGSPQRDKSRTRHSQVTHFFFEGCKYWSPLHSSADDLHALHPSWITDDTSTQEADSRTLELVRLNVPAGATVLVASRGNEEMVNIEGRQGWHFPQDARGVWLGYYPADSQVAIQHLEELWARGAEYLVLPYTALWWLDHYPEFVQHLESRCTKLLDKEDGCVLFALPPRADKQR